MTRRVIVELNHYGDIDEIELDEYMMEEDIIEAVYESVKEFIRPYISWRIEKDEDDE